MTCKECQIVEMRVKKVEGDKMTFVCPKCGKEEMIDIKDIKASK